MRFYRDFLLSPLVFLTLLAYLTRLSLYRLGIIKSVKVRSFVLSVGNLSMGGAGKTPMIAYLLSGFLQRGVSVGLVNRSYGARQKKPVIVPGPKEKAFNPRVLGDEICFLKNKFPSVPMATGKSKVQNAMLLTSRVDVDVTLVDDGFQHWRLDRDLDIVLVDSTDAFSDMRPFPLGRAREPFSALGRADVIVLSKTNLSDPESVRNLRQRIQSWLGPQCPPVFEAVHELVGLRRLGEEKIHDIDFLKGKRLGLVSAIARPEGFESMVKSCNLGPIAFHKRYRDHAFFSEKEHREVRTLAEKKGCTTIVLTEKDGVKWPRAEDSLNVFECVMSFRIVGGEEDFWREIYKKNS